MADSSPPTGRRPPSVPLRARSRLLLLSHEKRTISRARTGYGARCREAVGLPWDLDRCGLELAHRHGGALGCKVRKDLSAAARRAVGQRRVWCVAPRWTKIDDAHDLDAGIHPGVPATSDPAAGPRKVRLSAFPAS